MTQPAMPLAGRVALVTGVSRRAGIGFALARRLLGDGAQVFVHSWVAHDEEQPWGADPGGLDAVLHELGGSGGSLAHRSLDLGRPTGPAELVDAVIERFGAIDVLVANHARSSEQDLEALTADELDRCWAVNARGSLLTCNDSQPATTTRAQVAVCCCSRPASTSARWRTSCRTR